MSDATATKPDAAVEELMMALIRQGAMHGSYEKLPVEKCPYCQEKLDALRKRIKALVAQAVSEALTQAYGDGQDDVGMIA